MCEKDGELLIVEGSQTHPLELHTVLSPFSQSIEAEIIGPGSNESVRKPCRTGNRDDHCITSPDPTTANRGRYI